MDAIACRFDRAAAHYDGSAPLQKWVAERLVARAVMDIPSTILDLGCGTGFVAQAADYRFPRALLTAMDASPAMLVQTQRKVPRAQMLEGDAAAASFKPEFDLIFSSMMLHWLPDPLKALMRWRRWLAPGGSLHVGLLADGSFREWRDVCRVAGVQDGLWPMPNSHFADDVARAESEDIVMTYPSALDFLRGLKKTGAAAPRANHRSLSGGAMRRLLAHAPEPFPVTYRVLYLDMPSQGNS